MSADDSVVDYLDYMMDASKYRPAPVAGAPEKKPGLLGTKRFGELYLMESTDPTHEKVVAQRAPEEGRAQQVFREVEMFIKMRPHPAFCGFKGFFPQPTAVILEYLPNGTLNHMLEKIWKGEPDPHWTPTLRAKIIFGLAAGLMHLHAHNGVHRYITLSSILFDAKWEPRLTDFGFAKITVETNATQTVIAATNDYELVFMAPEMLSDTRASYSNKVDVYAYGQLLYAVVTGLSPVPEEVKTAKGEFQKQRRLVEDCARAKIPDDVDEAVRTLITNCWSPTPDQRPEFSVIVRDLLAYDQPLIPGVDMDEYMAYRMRIMEATSRPPDFTEAGPNPADEQKFQDVSRRAEAGDVMSLITMGRMYEKGQGCEANPERAFECYHQAAERGNPIGMYNTGTAFLQGIGTKRNAKTAVEWYRRAADTRKLPAADLAYALCLEEGRGIDKNIDEALSIYERLSQAPHEMRDAMHGQARILEEMGRGADARVWYQRAGDKGCDQAASDLAVMLLLGKSVPEDIPEGIRLLKMAAGRSLPMANYNLGHIYETGKYGEVKDVNQARKCYEAAAKGGSILGILRLTSMMFRDAAGMPEGPDRTAEEEKAARILLWGLEQERHTIILHNVAKLKIEGRGMPRDVQGGIRLMSESARKSDGWMAAMYLGNLFETGREDLGVPPSPDNARNSFRRAIDIGRELKKDNVVADAEAALARLG